MSTKYASSGIISDAFKKIPGYWYDFIIYFYSYYIKYNSTYRI